MDAFRFKVFICLPTGSRVILSERQNAINGNLYAWDESGKTNSVRIRFPVIERKDQDAVSRTEMRMIC